MIEPLYEPEFSISHPSEHYRAQNYKLDWEKLPSLKDWLRQGKNLKRARCVFCDVEMTADICVIKSHGRGVRHKRRLLGEEVLPVDQNKPSIGHYNPKWENEPLYGSWLRRGRVDSKAECSLCDVEFRAEKTVLRNHSKSKRHARAESHAKRVQEMTEIWGTEQRLVAESDAVAPVHRSTTDVIRCEPDTTKVTESEVLSQYLLRGYSRMEVKCEQCQNNLMLNNNGLALCVLCAEDTDDLVSNHDSDEEIVPIDGDGEGGPRTAYFRGEDGQLMCLELMEEVDNEDTVSSIATTETNTNTCLIQGLDLSPDVTRLVQVLRDKLAAVNSQIVAGRQLEQALTRLDSLVALLDKIKAL